MGFRTGDSCGGGGDSCGGGGDSCGGGDSGGDGGDGDGGGDSGGGSKYLFAVPKEREGRLLGFGADGDIQRHSRGATVRWLVSGDTLKTLSPSRSPTIPPPLPLQLYIFPHTDDISTTSRHSNCIINQTQSETGQNPAPTITISGNPIVVVFLHCSPIPLFVDVYSL